MNTVIFDDKYFMRIAIKEAQKAYEQNEIPIGAVIVWNNKIIGKGYNQTEILQDPTAHAEIIAITAATQNLGAKYLQQASLYVTVEPCIMCIGAIYWAKIKRIVWATAEPKTGFWQFETIINNYKKSFLNPKTEISYGILENEAKELLQNFFKLKRK